MDDKQYQHPTVDVVDPKEHYDSMVESVERIADDEESVVSWDDIQSENPLLASIVLFPQEIKLSSPAPDQWDDDETIDALVHALNHEVLHDVLYHVEDHETAVALDRFLHNVVDERDLLSMLYGDPKSRRDSEMGDDSNESTHPKSRRSEE